MFKKAHLRKVAHLNFSHQVSKLFVEMSEVLEEDLDPNYEPSDDEILEYAKWLGMDLIADRDLIWIAKEGLKAPLPPNWKPCKTRSSEEIYYFNFETGESSWDHPCDAFYKKLFSETKRKKDHDAKVLNTNRESSDLREKLIPLGEKLLPKKQLEELAIGNGRLDHGKKKDQEIHADHLFKNEDPGNDEIDHAEILQLRKKAKLLHVEPKLLPNVLPRKCSSARILRPDDLALNTLSNLPVTERNKALDKHKLSNSNESDINKVIISLGCNSTEKQSHRCTQTATEVSSVGTLTTDLSHHFSNVSCFTQTEEDHEVALLKTRLKELSDKLSQLKSEKHSNPDPSSAGVSKSTNTEAFTKAAESSDKSVQCTYYKTDTCCQTSSSDDQKARFKALVDKACWTNFDECSFHSAKSNYRLKELNIENFDLQQKLLKVEPEKSEHKLEIQAIKTAAAKAVLLEIEALRRILDSCSRKILKFRKLFSGLQERFKRVKTDVSLRKVASKNSFNSNFFLQIIIVHNLTKVIRSLTSISKVNKRHMMQLMALIVVCIKISGQALRVSLPLKNGDLNNTTCASAVETPNTCADKGKSFCHDDEEKITKKVEDSIATNYQVSACSSQSVSLPMATGDKGNTGIIPDASCLNNTLETKICMDVYRKYNNSRTYNFHAQRTILLNNHRQWLKSFRSELTENWALRNSASLAYK